MSTELRAPATDAQTATDADADCVAGNADCPGLDADLPCFECYRHRECPEGRTDCDNRAGADGTDYCRRCTLRRLS